MKKLKEVYQKNERIWDVMLIAFFTAIFVSLAFNNNAWEDEIYSMRWTALSWKDMIRRLIDDVHPPLYYIILKIVNGISQKSLIIAKLFSVLPVIGCLWIGITFVKRELGKKAMLFYCFFLSFVPCMMEKTVEVRMYTWTIFFCIFAGIWMYQLMQEVSRKKWIYFTLASLGAAYMHYYGVATMIFVYAALLLYFLFVKKWREVGQFFLCCAATVIGYLPWLPFGLGQITAVNEDYWITAPSSRLALIRELFESNFPHSEKILLALVMLLIVVLFVLWVNKRNKEIYWALSMCAPIWCILVMGLVYGELVRPVLISRYLIIPLGIMILGLSLAWKYLNKYLLGILCILLLFIGIAEYQAVFQAEYVTLTKETKTFTDENILQGDIIVWDIGSLSNSILYYVPQAQPYSMDYNIYTENYERIWVFCRDRNAINFDGLKDNQIQYTDFGNYGFDNIYFSVFLLTK